MGKATGADNNKVKTQTYSYHSIKPYKTNHHHNKCYKLHALKTSRISYSSPCLDLKFTFNQRHASYLEFPPLSRHIQTFLKTGIHIQPALHELPRISTNVSSHSNFSQTWDSNSTSVSYITPRLDLGFSPRYDLKFTLDQCHASYLEFPPVSSVNNTSQVLVSTWDSPLAWTWNSHSNSVTRVTKDFHQCLAIDHCISQRTNHKSIKVLARSLLTHNITNLTNHDNNKVTKNIIIYYL